MNFQSRILVIDDDERLGKTIKNVLSAQGYDVRYANNGSLGVQLAFEYNPDLVLCDVRMDPIDGYQVYKILKESSLIDYVPFLFLTVCSNLEDIRFGMDLGADDYFVKPFNNDNLIRSIESRLSKFKILKESGRPGFKTLFEFSPNGIFLFNRTSIIDANPAFLKMLGIDSEKVARLRIEDIFDKDSLRRIKDKLLRCYAGIGESFHECVNISIGNKLMSDTSILISTYERNSISPMMIGMIHVDNESIKRVTHGHIESEVVQMLAKENIIITNSLRKKLAEIFKQQSTRMEKEQGEFFSKREYQILKLSMEGLPMKLIADRLSISFRTVENHRAKMMEKTGANNIVEVIVYALRNNLIRI
ncbi:MAG: response regulator [Mangrovibacterium sp.]